MLEQASNIYSLNLIIGLIWPILIITVNSIEIHLLRKTLNKRSYEKLLLSMSICDLISGVITMTAVPYYFIFQDEFYIDLYWMIWGFTFCYFSLTTLLHLIMIGLDRLWAIGAPFHHRIHASNKKLIIAVGLSWFVPLIFTVFYIVLYSAKGAHLKMSYVFRETLMYPCLAKFIIGVDIVLLCCYCAIICIMAKRNIEVKQKKHNNQANSKNTFMLCMGIVFVFIVCTTPSVAIYITTWKPPQWLETLNKFVFPLNQVCNSLLYFLQKYRRSKRPVNALKETNQTQDTRL